MLTNFIKENFKNKTANSQRPFHKGKIWNIEFDNTERYEIWKSETDIVNDIPFKRTLKELSGTLSRGKTIYIKYLNDRWETLNK
jgi:hypothetical protein